MRTEVSCRGSEAARLQPICAAAHSIARAKPGIFRVLFALFIDLLPTISRIRSWQSRTPAVPADNHQSRWQPHSADAKHRSTTRLPAHICSLLPAASASWPHVQLPLPGPESVIPPSCETGCSHPSIRAIASHVIELRLVSQQSFSD